MGDAPWRHTAESYDGALAWLTASDAVVSDRLASALIQIRRERLYHREGHARWSTYLRAFVGPTARWCQQEMKRVRELRGHPLLSEAWGRGEIGKSHLRILFRVVTPETEASWLEAARTLPVRLLDRLAREELMRRRDEEACTRGGSAAGSASGTADAPDPDEPNGRRRCRTVMAPPSIAAMVVEAVEVARKLDGYHIGAGSAVAMMAAETLTALNRWPDEGGRGQALADGPDGPSAGIARGDSAPAVASDTGAPAGIDRARSGEGSGAGAGVRNGSLLGDEQELRRELGRLWEAAHEQAEGGQRFRGIRRRDLPRVIFDGAPADDADAHERVVFWSAVMGRMDALRGRLLSFMQSSNRLDDLCFAGLGHYARERMGLTGREAWELVRLDRALVELPVAYRMYASGRLGKRKAWLVSRVATRRTDRAWTKYALTHTLRLLEAVVEKHDLIGRTGSPRFGTNDGMPPQDATFAETIRACSLLKGQDSVTDPVIRVRLVMDEAQQEVFVQALQALRAEYGAEKPDWWCLGVMAKHFLDSYGELDRQAVPAKLRRALNRKIIERDNYTCSAPECLQRGGLESDHVELRSQGGTDDEWNLQCLCGAEHRYSKHQAGTLAMHGRAPDELVIRMGSRIYHNDRLVEPAFDDRVLDEDPWR